MKKKIVKKKTRAKKVISKKTKKKVVSKKVTAKKARKVTKKVTPRKKVVSKVSKSTRSKISKSLKRYHALKKQLTGDFDVSTKRVRVKSFPKKTDKENFFYSDKRYYELKAPIIIEGEQDIIEAVSKIDGLIDLMWNDYKTTIKNKLLNVGYHIGLTFTDKKGNVKEDFTVLTVSYLDSFLADSKSELREMLEFLKQSIEERFKEYLMRQGFYEMALFGFETEMSRETFQTMERKAYKDPRFFDRK